MTQETLPLHYRIPLLVMGMFMLLLGLYTGILKLGFAVPAPNPNMWDLHGPFMVCGFLGTVIGLERAVAYGKTWAYTAPLLSGLGGFLLLLMLNTAPGILLVFAASAVMTAVFALHLRRSFEPFLAVMAAGSAAWLIGNSMWLFGAQVFQVALLWAAFLILTIAGERLELSRFRGHSRATLTVFTLFAALFAGGVAAAGFGAERGVAAAGAGMALMAAWLVKNDIAMVTIRQAGLTRYMAVCLLLGYFWLFAGGVLVMTADEWAPGPWYDAALHSVFLGFAFSMIFAHAPVIFPAVAGIPVTYTPLFYIHLALLHVTLPLRVIGDVAGLDGAAMAGGALNVLVIAVFLINTVASVIRGMGGGQAGS